MDNILKDEYDFIFSIGEACSCTAVLRASNLQFESYPLDWLWGGNIETRTNLLINDFKGFFDKENLKLVGNKQNPLPCDIYKNISNSIVFNHDFPLDGSFDSDYPAIKEKYDRRIKRLYNNIEKAQNILIVYIQAPNTDDGKIKYLRKRIEDCYEKISKKWEDKNIKLLYLFPKKPFFIEKRIERLNKNILLARFNYRHPDLTTEPHVVNERLLCKFFSGIKLNKNVIKIQEKKVD